MNKKDSREVIRIYAAMWENNAQEAAEKQKTLKTGSDQDSFAFNDQMKYRSMKQSVLMVAESLGLITEDEYDACMKNGVNSALKSEGK